MRQLILLLLGEPVTVHILTFGFNLVLQDHPLWIKVARWQRDWQQAAGGKTNGVSCGLDGGDDVL
jgi:hypothetical protein